MSKVLLDTRSTAFAQPQLSLLFGQIEQAQQWLTWLTQGCPQAELESVRHV